MKKAMMVILCMLMWGGSAYAVCVGTITATTPTADFTDNGDGTVTHKTTGLMWKQCSEGLSGAGCATGIVAATYTWQGALQHAVFVNTGTFAGFSDWRVPNIKELNSIVESQCSIPAINAAIFPTTSTNAYWSSSPYAAATTFAWGVAFNIGGEVVNGKSTSSRVRLVRGGL